MTEALVGLVVTAVVAPVVLWWRRRRPVAIVIAAEPDAALLSSAAALRRLGARITRYDTEAGTLEARLTPTAIVRVRTAAADGGTTRVHLDGDAAARRVIRRFRGALST
jgi:hypothetical protein